MPTVCVRVTEGEKAAWASAAGGKRLLSKYIRAAMNERVGATNGDAPQEKEKK